MGLLGTPVLIVLAAAAALAPIAVCLSWPRVRGPVLVRGAVRLAMLATAQILAICLVAGLINDYGLFYNSWSELAAGASQFAGLGSQPAQHPELVANSRPSDTGVTVRPEPGYTDPGEWSRRGRLESVTIRGAVSGLRSHAFVYLPPQYFQPAYASRYFPAVEVFTGYPGIDQYLVSRLKYPDVLRRLIERHHASAAVLVMMRPSVTFPRDTECTDVPDGPQAETFFATDVPSQIGKSYRVLPSSWGAIGDSTGGYCAAKLAMLNPGTFRAAAEMSGYFFALHDRTTGSLWGGSAIVRQLNDLAWRLRHLPAPPVSLLEGTSPAEQGSDGYVQAMRFAQLVKAPMRVSVMTVPHGGHNIATWAAELPAALRWLIAHLAPPCSSSVPVQPGQVDLGMTVAGTALATP